MGRESGITSPRATRQTRAGARAPGHVGQNAVSEPSEPRGLGRSGAGRPRAGQPKWEEAKPREEDARRQRDAVFFLTTLLGPVFLPQDPVGDIRRPLGSRAARGAFPATWQFYPCGASGSLHVSPRRRCRPAGGMPN